MSDTMDSSEDWRKKKTSLHDQLWFMYKFQLCANMKIVVSNDFKNQTFLCHQLVVARLCPAFEKHIDEFIDSTGEKKECTIEVKNFNPDYFEAIMRYAYTDSPSLSSMLEALAILQWSCDNKSKQLKLLCENYISSHVNKHSVWDILNTGLKAAQITTWAKSHLGKHSSSCLKSENFLNCTEQTLMDVLRMQRLNLSSELEVVEAVIRWLRHKTSCEGQLDVDRAQTLLGAGLQHIRFMALTAAEFSQHVTTSGLLRNDECLAVLVNLSSPGQMPLPANICKITQPREKPQIAVASSARSSRSVTPTFDEKPKSKDQRSRKHSPGPAKNEKLVLSVRKEERVFEPRKENGVTESRITNMLPPEVGMPIQFKQNRPGPDLIFMRAVNPRRYDQVATPLSPVTKFKVNKAALLKGVYLNPRLAPVMDLQSSMYMESVHILVNCGKERIAYMSFHGRVPYGPHQSYKVDFSNPGRLQQDVVYEMKVILPSEGIYRINALKNEVAMGDAKLTFLNGDKNEETSFVLGFVLSFL